MQGNWIPMERGQITRGGRRAFCLGVGTADVKNLRKRGRESVGVLEQRLFEKEMVIMGIPN